jgi:hypothetical protein
MKDKFIIIAIILFLSLSYVNTAYTDVSFAKSGTFEIGGSMAFLYDIKKNDFESSSEDYKTHTLNLFLGPFLNYYVIDQFHIGGRVGFDYRKKWIEYETYSSDEDIHYIIGPGLKCGYTIPLNSFIYFDISAIVTFYYDFDDSGSNAIFYNRDLSYSAIPSLKIDSGNGIITLSAGYTYYHDLDEDNGTMERTSIDILRLGFSIYL